jgi:hypothetical protein
MWFVRPSTFSLDGGCMFESQKDDVSFDRERRERDEATKSVILP